MTVGPSDVLAPIHNRMPAILRREDEALWLDRSVTDPLAAMSCLRPYESARLEAFPVSNLVNSVDNEGPELLEPAAAAV